MSKDYEEKSDDTNNLAALGAAADLSSNSIFSAVIKMYPHKTFIVCVASSARKKSHAGAIITYA